MLRVGLSGGIGSGKSTVSARLTELGAHVVDADRVAREVVEPGTPALAAIRDRFGADVITDGALDRPALGRIVFADQQARRDLEAITHPAIAARTANLMAAVQATDPAGVLVHDVPLLVELGTSAEYHLVLGVHAPVEERVRRLVADRGMAEADARARIAAQADDDARRRASDVILDNTGTREELVDAVDRLWRERLVPFARNLATGQRAPRPALVRLVDPDPTWPEEAERLLGRIGGALGAAAATLDHIGSTAVPVAATDVIDLQLGVEELAVADDPAVIAALAAAGFPRVPGVDRDNPKDGAPWPKRFHGSSDPGRVVHLHVREVGSPGWRRALLFRDALRADAGTREEYVALKRSILAADAGWDSCLTAKEPRFDAVHDRIEEWALATGWSPSAAVGGSA